MFNRNAVRLMAVCAVFVLMSVTAAAQSEPLAAPLSPEQTRALPAELRNDPRAMTGAIALGTYLVTSGCGNGQTIVSLAVILPPTGQFYLRTTAYQGISGLYMNQRVSLVSNSPGVTTLSINAATTGGPTGHAFPLTANTPATVEMLLTRADGFPLWYTRGTYDCDGSPNFLSNIQSGPARVLNPNASFDSAGASSKTAANWTFLSKTSRTCAALPGDCAIKIKAKNLKSGGISQVRKYKKAPLETGIPYGFVVIFDSTGAAGNLNAELRLKVAGNGTMEVVPRTAVLSPGEQEQRQLFSGLNSTSSLSFPVDRVTLTITHTNSPAGTLYLRAAYVWVIDELY